MINYKKPVTNRKLSELEDKNISYNEPNIWFTYYKQCNICKQKGCPYKSH